LLVSLFCHPGIDRVEETEGHRGERKPYKGKRAVEAIEGHGGDRGSWRQ
jgi:hypothetical protein